MSHKKTVPSDLTSLANFGEVHDVDANRLDPGGLASNA
jgi:hypothetical protein